MGRALDLLGPGLDRMWERLFSLARLRSPLSPLL